MNAQKLSISLPYDQCEFIDDYQAENHLKTRSEVIKAAVYLLQQSYLKSCYREANQEINSDFESTTQDGLDDETW
ncbi:MAG: ribbon-helix-helix domain-containing protein [Gammaproteobacteria bacterium]|nr:ribbon-helix-helix domain-containing protein [Gammaproteobacteria bacterium]